MIRNALDVTGRGLVSSLGSTVGEFHDAIFAGRSAIVDISDFGVPLRFSKGAPIRDFNPHDHFTERDLVSLDRFTQFAACAARTAWVESGLDHEKPDSARIAVVVGTANSGVDSLNECYKRIFGDKMRPHPMTIPRTMASAPASRIANEIGARGPVFAISSACASAAHAMIVGANLIRSEMVDIAVVGGTDSCYSEGFLRAWDVLRIVSPDTCRPFSIGRKGLIVGEGAGILVLERAGRAVARGARPIARFLGGGMSSDAGDLIAPSQEGMERAMRGALEDAGVHPEAVTYVNAHGTGTIANDRAESAAIASLFGARKEAVSVSATKSLHGHAMGASGALEAIATIAALEHDTVPPTANYIGPDPDIAIDVTPNIARARSIEVALSNSFAFGGLNVSLAFART